MLTPATRTIETTAGFFQRHGNDATPMFDMGGGEATPLGGKVFSDGATIDENGNRQEPPDEPVPLCRIQIRYLESLAYVNQADFGRVQNYIHTQAQWHALGAANLPHPRAFEDLKKLKREGRNIAARLRRARERLRKLYGGKMPDEFYRDRRADERAAAERCLAEMRIITGKELPPMTPAEEAALEREARKFEAVINEAVKRGHVEVSRPRRNILKPTPELAKP